MAVAHGGSVRDHGAVASTGDRLNKPNVSTADVGVRTSVLSDRVHSAPMRILWRFLRERKALFSFNLVLRLLKDVLPFASPILVGIAVDILTGTDKSLFGFDFLAFDNRSIMIVAGLMGVLAVAKVILGFVSTMASAQLGRQIVEAARRDMADAVMQMTLEERRRFNSGDLLDRSLTDSKGIRTFTQSVVIRTIANTVRAVLPLWLLFSYDTVMALVVVAVIPLQSTFSALLQRRLQRQTRRARTQEAAHTSAVKEAIDGWSSVVSVGGQDWVTDELKATAAASEDAKIKKKQTTASISAVINLCTALGIAACYGIGGWRIIDAGIVSGDDVTAGALTMGGLTTFIGVAKKTYAPFQAYTKIVSSYRTGLVNLERIAEVIEAPMQDPRPNGPVLSVTSGTVDLNSISFSYGDGGDAVLSGVTGQIPGRALTVITGSSGAGKTTLLRMLMGLDVPSHGTITIDGQDINTARLSSVRRAMALVPQEPMLFTGTLGENLLFGNPDATTEDLLNACHKAGLLELVRELPKGLDTEVGSGRHMLSGGQLRRMAIARALLREPAILLLDEPTTGLDQHRSEQVLDTLRSLSAFSTVIMVSHRSDPLATSDHHFILADGSWHTGDGTRSGTSFADAPATSANGASSRSGPDANANAATSAATGHAVNDPTAAPDSRVSGPTPQPKSVPIPQVFDPQTIGMSAMGRPIRLNAVLPLHPAETMLVVGGHRSEPDRLEPLSGQLLAEAALDRSTNVGVIAIDDLNPDGRWTNDQRTVLGIDLSADHQRHAATETRILHDIIGRHNVAALVDVACDTTRSERIVDVEVVMRFNPSGVEATLDWVEQMSNDVRRRLATSRFTFSISVEPCTIDSATAALDIVVIELTARDTPDSRFASRTGPAVAEATSAVYRSLGLSRPALVNS